MNVLCFFCTVAAPVPPGSSSPPFFQFLFPSAVVLPVRVPSGPSVRLPRLLILAFDEGGLFLLSPFPIVS